MNLGGSLTRQTEHDSSVSDASPHIVNIGKMVEVSSINTFHIYFHATDSKSTTTLRLEPLLTQNQTSLNEQFTAKIFDTLEFIWNFHKLILVWKK